MSPRRFGILLFPGAEALDFVGPWEMLRIWSRYAGGPPECLLVAQSVAPVAFAEGMRILRGDDLTTCPSLDALLVPGGQGTRHEVDNPVLVDFVRRQAAQAQVLMLVCTGALVLHAAGLLEGRRATTHWGMLPRLRSLAGVKVVEERFVQDGPVWTSAGVSAGIDMMLAYITQVASADTTGQVQFAAEYYPDGVRYGNAAQDPRAPAYVRAG